MAAPLDRAFQDVIEDFHEITYQPEDFISFQRTHGDNLIKSLKSLYDATKASDSLSRTPSDTLTELTVEGFDDEQIWQQLELENESFVNNLVTKVAKILADKGDCTFKSHVFSDSASTSESNLIIDNLDKIKSSHERKKKGKKKKEEEHDEVKEEDSSFVEERLSEGLNDSDEELDKIQSRLGNRRPSVDDDDKFFDFTGDSDDDLNFDLGPLSKNFKEDESDFVGEKNEPSDSKSSTKKKKGKKSVTFKDEVNESQTLTDDKPSPKSSGKGKSKTVQGLVSKIGKRSIVDDRFFKLYEMEAYLDQEDRREARRTRKQDLDDDDDDNRMDDDDDDDEEDIDLFEDIPSSKEDYHYDDFFDAIDDSVGINKTTEGKVENSDDDNDDQEDDDFDDEDDDDDDESNNKKENFKADVKRQKSRDLFADSDSSEGEYADEVLGLTQPQKSTFEVRQEKLKQKISEMEEASLAEKPWQLKGEITAESRPENSLLQENLQFELTTRLAPEITEETTQTLEQLIRQRIKDQSWNDVERKVKPKENVTEYKKRITLDQEKSKLSLGEIYEQEYLKEQAKDKQEIDEPVKKEHEEIKKMMQSLFIKLDALSNSHYTPKQVMPEVKIVADQPTINMEEVAPVAVSENTVLAPEEVQEKQQGELIGDTEKTKTDRLRERRKKKELKKKKLQQKKNEKKQIEKLNPGLGNKYSKEKALKQLEKESKGEKKNLTVIKGDSDKTNLTSSKAFFTQLQEEVKLGIKSKKEGKRKNQIDMNSNAKKFKL